MDGGDIFGPLAGADASWTGVRTGFGDGGEQLAQAASPLGAAVDLQPIGQVETLSGMVTVLRADGQQNVLREGDPVHQDDRIQTGADGSVGVTFVDGSTLSLGVHGTMVLDRFVYDPASGEGLSSVSLLQGVFSFASGAIAKSDPDASIITTPVGTIGVRGTTGAGQAGPEGTENTLILVLDADGSLGEILWSTPGGVSVLNQMNQFLTTMSAFQAPGIVVLTSDQVAALFGSVLAGLPNPLTTRFNFDATRPVGDPGDGGEDVPSPPDTVPEMGDRTDLGGEDLLTLADLTHGDGGATAFGEIFDYLDRGGDLGTFVAKIRALPNWTNRFLQHDLIETKTRLGQTTETTTSDFDTTDTTETSRDAGTVSGRFTMTSGDDVVTGDSGDTVFIFDQSKNGGLGGTDSISDIGGSDSLLIQDPGNLAAKFGALANGSQMLAWQNIASGVATSSLSHGAALQSVEISRDIESLSVSHNGQTYDMSKALSLSSGDHAWLLAGNSENTTFTLDDSKTVLSMLFAGEGNDIVDVKSGSGHSLYGEGGDDAFWLHQGASVDVIDGGVGTDAVFSSTDAASLSVGSLSNVEALVRVGTSDVDMLTPSGTVGGMAFTHVWGREGADSIDTGNGTLGVLYSSVDIDGNADTISNFTAGTGGDQLVFDNDILTRTGEFASFSNNIDSNAGVVVYKSTMFSFSPTNSSEVASFLAGQGLSGLGTGEKIVFVVGTSSESAAWYWNDAEGNQDGIVDDGELTHLATLSGVDISSMTEDNVSVSSDDALFQYQET